MLANELRDPFVSPIFPGPPRPEASSSIIQEWKRSPAPTPDGHDGREVVNAWWWDGGQGLAWSPSCVYNVSTRRKPEAKEGLEVVYAF